MKWLSVTSERPFSKRALGDWALKNVIGIEVVAGILGKFHWSTGSSYYNHGNRNKNGSIPNLSLLMH